MGAIKHNPNETAEENNARAEAMKKHIDRVHFLTHDGKIILRASPRDLELWEKLMKDEAEKSLKKYPETRESSLLNPVEGDSRQIEDSLQEEDM